MEQNHTLRNRKCCRIEGSQRAQFTFGDGIVQAEGISAGEIEVIVNQRRQTGQIHGIHFVAIGAQKAPRRIQIEKAAWAPPGHQPAQKRSSSFLLYWVSRLVIIQGELKR